MGYDPGYRCHAFRTRPLDTLEGLVIFKLTRPLLWEPRPSFKQDKISESKELKTWVDKYLGMGEWVMDNSIALMGSSGWFERKR